MKLYEAYSLVNYRGFKDVHFHWFANRKEPIIKPEDALTDYHTLNEDEKPYALSYVNELLTEDEAMTLRDYLRNYHDTDLQVKSVDLPIEGVRITGDGARVGISGVGILPVGGMTDFYMLSREETYNLDTPIWGYFNLEGCEPAKDLEALRHLYRIAFDCRGRWLEDRKDACLSMLWRELLPAVDILVAQEVYGLEFDILTWCEEEHPILGAIDDNGDLCIWHNDITCLSCQCLTSGPIAAVVNKLGKTLRAPNGQEWNGFILETKLGKGQFTLSENPEDKLPF